MRAIFIPFVGADLRGFRGGRASFTDTHPCRAKAVSVDGDIDDDSDSDYPAGADADAASASASAMIQVLQDELRQMKKDRVAILQELPKHVKQVKEKHEARLAGARSTSTSASSNINTNAQVQEGGGAAGGGSSSTSNAAPDAKVAADRSHPDNTIPNAASDSLAASSSNGGGSEESSSGQRQFSTAQRQFAEAVPSCNGKFHMLPGADIKGLDLSGTPTHVSSMDGCCAACSNMGKSCHGVVLVGGRYCWLKRDGLLSALSRDACNGTPFSWDSHVAAAVSITESARLPEQVERCEDDLDGSMMDGTL